MSNTKTTRAETTAERLEREHREALAHYWLIVKAVLAGLLIGMIVGWGCTSAHAKCTPHRDDSIGDCHPLSAIACGEDSALQDFIAAYVGRVNTTLTAEQCDEVADLCCTGIDPLRLAALARYESTFRVYAVNKSSGCRGLWQIHPCHRKRMERLGLDIAEPADQRSFADLLFEERGWQPWCVRAKAKREYARLQREWKSQNEGENE